MRRNLRPFPALVAPHLVFLIPELLMAAGPFVVQTVAKAGRTGFKMPDFFYGGQALIEGVMMRGRTTVAMSVRPPSGEVVTLSEPLPAALQRSRWLKVPFVRGLFVLYETLILGTRMLMRSAALAAEGEDIQIGRGMMIGTMIFSLGFAVAIFFLLPLFLSTFADDATDSDLIANIIEGLIRLIVFVAYIGLIGMMSEIRRVFAYHGAEHKAISAHEADAPLTPAEVDRFSTAHTRCGTTFLLIVVVISIFFFSFIPRTGVPLPLLFLSRIALVPLIASVSYELVRFGASHYGNRLVRAIYQPGLWLQSLTTRPPDRGMLEVSIASLESCLASDRAAGTPTVEPTAAVVDPNTGVLPLTANPMIERLREIEGRYDALAAEMSSPGLDVSRLTELGRELARLEPVVNAIRAWDEVQGSLRSTREMADDPDEEVRAMAREELSALETRAAALEAELRVLLVPRDPNDDRNVILEVRAGTGGDEAALFAGDLYRMYARYADGRHWRLELLSSSESAAGGFKEAIAEITGSGAYSRLKYESGVHRVQRVPVTEAQGRIHTSTATVSVLPEADEVEVDIPEKDLRIDVYRSSGPGGQSVNTTDSAVRITHLPTGLVVAIQDEKSQHKNKARAMAVLRARLLEMEQQRQAEERGEQRRSQVGTGERSEKIRTYNFPDDRVTDHRIGLTVHNLPGLLQGDLDRLIEPLAEADQAARLAAVGAEGDG